MPQGAPRASVRCNQSWIRASASTVRSVTRSTHLRWHRCAGMVLGGIALRHARLALRARFTLSHDDEIVNQAVWHL